ncbi:SDR family oxidoreductase [Candidatus Nitrospira nitrificans]|nr:SDR family oxidoreductase [Candidatus Nitrospira nitrificans]
MSKVQRPPQQQARPGEESRMMPRPISTGETSQEKIGDRLQGKVALVTGGDSGIGRAVAFAFAREGADLAIVYLSEDKDAEDTKRFVEELGRRCIALRGDIGDEAFCIECVSETLTTYGRLDILVNNAAEQHPRDSIGDITAVQLERTFRTNVFSMFYLTKAALPHLRQGASIINTTSVTAYKGSPKLLDYASTKGAIVSFTRSLALSLVENGIRVNAVSPGPIWTPLIVSTFPPDKVASFGSDVPLKRAGQPAEVAPSYVFLASADADYMTGQVLHPNGGTIVNG